MLTLTQEVLVNYQKSGSEGLEPPTTWLTLPLRLSPPIPVRGLDCIFIRSGCPPYSLYTFLSRGLARDCHFKGFPEFEGISPRHSYLSSRTFQPSALPIELRANNFLIRYFQPPVYYWKDMKKLLMKLLLPTLQYSFWSERPDSDWRPLAPEASALNQTELRSEIMVGTSGFEPPIIPGPKPGAIPD